MTSAHASRTLSCELIAVWTALLRDVRIVLSALSRSNSAFSTVSIVSVNSFSHLASAFFSFSGISFLSVAGPLQEQNRTEPNRAEGRRRRRRRWKQGPRARQPSVPATQRDMTLQGRLPCHAT